jgi:hypothetical protein
VIFIFSIAFIFHFSIALSRENVIFYFSARFIEETIFIFPRLQENDFIFPSYTSFLHVYREKRFSFFPRLLERKRFSFFHRFILSFLHRLQKISFHFFPSFTFHFLHQVYFLFLHVYREKRFHFFHVYREKTIFILLHVYREKRFSFFHQAAFSFPHLQRKRFHFSTFIFSFLSISFTENRFSFFLWLLTFHSLHVYRENDFFHFFHVYFISPRFLQRKTISFFHRLFHFSPANVYREKRFSFF